LFAWLAKYKFSSHLKKNACKFTTRCNLLTPYDFHKLKIKKTLQAPFEFNSNSSSLKPVYISSQEKYCKWFNGKNTQQTGERKPALLARQTLIRIEKISRSHLRGNLKRIKIHISITRDIFWQKVE